MEDASPLLLDSKGMALAPFYLGYFKIPQGWGLWKDQVDTDMIRGCLKNLNNGIKWPKL